MNDQNGRASRSVEITHTHFGQKSHRNNILRVLFFIQEHLDEKLEREHLAQLAHMSPFHFYRIFKATVGEGLMEHVRRLRMERAASSLRFSKEKVIDIALASGFSCHETFTRAFVSHFGRSPVEFRKHHRHRRHPALQDSGSRITNENSPLITVEAFLPRRVAFVRGQGPYMDAGAQAWTNLIEWAKTRIPLGPNTTYLGIPYDDPEVTPAELLRYDAMVEVHENFQTSGEIGTRLLPGGRFVKLCYKGPWSELGDGWWCLYSWLPVSGLGPSNGVSFEIYHLPITFPLPQYIEADLYLGIDEA